jgi:hypothetical protein
MNHCSNAIDGLNLGIPALAQQGGLQVVKILYTLQGFLTWDISTKILKNSDYFLSTV